MKKMTEHDLEKGMNALAEAALKNNTATRAADLFAKAQSGEITDDEKDELVKSLRGDELASKVMGGFQTDTIQKSIDVSDFLRDATVGITDGLRTLTDHIQKSQGDDHGYRVALATTLASMTDVITSQSEMLKSMASQLGVQPARGPMSKGVRGAQPMAKSFAGAPTQANAMEQGSDLSKSQILDGLDAMIAKGGNNASNGEDLVKASTKYESLNQISPVVLADVQKFLNTHKAN